VLMSHGRRECGTGGRGGQCRTDGVAFRFKNRRRFNVLSSSSIRTASSAAQAKR
jgi:hypothetical protein